MCTCRWRDAALDLSGDVAGRACVRAVLGHTRKPETAVLGSPHTGRDEATEIARLVRWPRSCNHTSMMPLRTSLLLLLLGCSAETTTVVTPADLCALAETAPSGELRLEVTLDDLSFGLIGHGALDCAEGECCNPALYSPYVACPEDVQITILASPTYTTDTAGTDAPSLECEGDIPDAPLATDSSKLGSPPPPECPSPTCGGPAGPVILIGALGERGAFVVTGWEAS